MAASPEEMEAGAGRMEIQGGRYRDGEEERSETETDPDGGKHRGTLTRVYTVPRCGGVALRVGIWAVGARGQRAQSPHYHLSLLPTLSTPTPSRMLFPWQPGQPKREGWGLQRKFSTSAAREEDVIQKRNWPIQWGPLGPLTSQVIVPTASGILTPLPPSKPAPSPLGHCGEG